MARTTVPTSRAITLAILVAALGYFVDIYDLILFSIVRVKSLQAIGVPANDVFDRGVLLINMQMSGMLVGGIVWGVLGDKRGRLQVLFGSILMYSLANVANGFVTNLGTYALLRFLAGIGLAGELGAGITLVSEIMPKESRGWGTTIVASVGVLGAVVAAVVGDFFAWRTAYFVGGGLGFALLLLRVGVLESGMYEAAARDTRVAKGDFFSLFRSWSRLKRYVAVIVVGVPIWYAIGILVTFAPEFGKALGLPEAPQASRAVLFAYVGLAAGDLASGALSQVFRSRRLAVGLFLLLTTLSVAAYFLVGGHSLTVFYAVTGVLGFAVGYWAVFVTMAAEQFGTNVRATATTTAPNFVRGAVVVLTSLFQLGKAHPQLGVLKSGMAVGAATLLLAFLAVWSLRETYGKDLDFVESDVP